MLGCQAMGSGCEFRRQLSVLFNRELELGKSFSPSCVENADILICKGFWWLQIFANIRAGYPVPKNTPPCECNQPHAALTYLSIIKIKKKFLRWKVKICIEKVKVLHANTKTWGRSWCCFSDTHTHTHPDALDHHNNFVDALLPPPGGILCVWLVFMSRTEARMSKSKMSGWIYVPIRKRTSASQIRLALIAAWCCALDCAPVVCHDSFTDLAEGFNTTSVQINTTALI